MRRVHPGTLMGLFAIANLILVTVGVLFPGWVGMWAIFLTSFFMSLMFPTIFALGLRDLGPNTKAGASLLVMAIIGAAVVPPIMGKISDLSNIQRAFWVPLLCYAYVLYFAAVGYKPQPALAQPL